MPVCSENLRESGMRPGTGQTSNGQEVEKMDTADDDILPTQSQSKFIKQAKQNTTAKGAKDPPAPMHKQQSVEERSEREPTVSKTPPKDAKLTAPARGMLGNEGDTGRDAKTSLLFIDCKTPGKPVSRGGQPNLDARHHSTFSDFRNGGLLDSMMGTSPQDKGRSTPSDVSVPPLPPAAEEMDWMPSDSRFLKKKDAVGGGRVPDSRELPSPMAGLEGEEAGDISEAKSCPTPGRGTTYTVNMPAPVDTLQASPGHTSSSRTSAYSPKADRRKVGRLAAGLLVLECHPAPMSS